MTTLDVKQETATNIRALVERMNQDLITAFTPYLDKAETEIARNALSMQVNWVAKAAKEFATALEAESVNWPNYFQTVKAKSDALGGTIRNLKTNLQQNSGLHLHKIDMNWLEHQADNLSEAVNKVISTFTTQAFTGPAMEKTRTPDEILFGITNDETKAAVNKLADTGMHPVQG